jgi:hypothetical protein
VAVQHGKRTDEPLAHKGDHPRLPHALAEQRHDRVAERIRLRVGKVTAGCIVRLILILNTFLRAAIASAVFDGTVVFRAPTKPIISTKKKSLHYVCVKSDFKKLLLNARPLNTAISSPACVFLTNSSSSPTNQSPIRRRFFFPSGPFLFPFLFLSLFRAFSPFFVPLSTLLKRSRPFLFIFFWRELFGIF